MTDAETERAAIELLGSVSSGMADIMRLTKYKRVCVTLNTDGGWQIEYSTEATPENSHEQ